MQAQKRLVRVVYHFPCPDGAYAALAAFLRYNKRQDVGNVLSPVSNFLSQRDLDLKFIPHATFRPLSVEDDTLFPSESEVFLYDTCLYLQKLTIYRLDYVGPQDFVPRISKKVKKVVLIDHHRTAFEYVQEWKASQVLPDNCMSLQLNLLNRHDNDTKIFLYLNQLRRI